MSDRVKVRYCKAPAKPRYKVGSSYEVPPVVLSLCLVSTGVAEGHVHKSLCKISNGIKVTFLDELKGNLTSLSNTQELQILLVLNCSLLMNLFL